MDDGGSKQRSVRCCSHGGSAQCLPLHCSHPCASTHGCLVARACSRQVCNRTSALDMARCQGTHSLRCRLPRCPMPSTGPCPSALHRAVKHCVKLRTSGSYRRQTGSALLVGQDLVEEVAGSGASVAALVGLDGSPLPGEHGHRHRARAQQYGAGTGSPRASAGVARVHAAGVGRAGQAVEGAF